MRILKFGKKAIPLLIRHLNDRRFFKHLTFCCLGNQDKPRKVTAGEVALDILMVIVRRDSPMFDFECLKILENGNTESRCVAEGYYEEKIGKRNWQKAYRMGKIRYKKREYQVTEPTLQK